jgi:hypothetical protein
VNRAHLDAIRAVLAPLGYPVHFVEAPTSNLADGTRQVPVPPYLVIWSSLGALSGAALDNVRADIDDTFGVTYVAGTPEAALVVGQRVRDVLTPLGFGDLSVPGRRAWVRHEDSRPIQVDRDVVARDLNRHPAYGVELFRLISTPA